MVTTSNIKTIGILGGGQLGMMLAEAALPLGYRCVFLEDTPKPPASLLGKVYSSDQLEAFIKDADVFTLEFENTPIETVQTIEALKNKAIHPPALALKTAQDRIAEKSLFHKLGIKTVPFCPVSTREELSQACNKLGLPLVLKTSRGGYDGKGQFVLKTTDDIATAWAELGGAVTGNGGLTSTPAPLIAEAFINFSREISVIAVRGQNTTHGKHNVRVYDVVENHHHNGILAKTLSPAVGTSHLTNIAHSAITTLMNHLNYIGVLSLELFVCKDGNGKETLLANEIAPRVHNSGHWSIEGAVTSQFENHIRAVVGLPLGDTDNIQPSIMINVLGQYPNLADVLSIDGSHYHGYHKQERDNRKIAHITLMPKDTSKLQSAFDQLIKILPNKVGLD